MFLVNRCRPYRSVTHTMIRQTIENMKLTIVNSRSVPISLCALMDTDSASSSLFHNSCWFAPFNCCVAAAVVLGAIVFAVVDGSVVVVVVVRKSFISSISDGFIGMALLVSMITNLERYLALVSCVYGERFNLVLERYKI